jgi:hypothetical protein
MNWIAGFATMTMTLAASSATAVEPNRDTDRTLGVSDVGRLIAVKPGEEIRIALPNPIGRIIHGGYFCKSTSL